MNNLVWNSHIEVRQNGIAFPLDEFGNTEFSNVYEAEMFILKSINNFRKNIFILKKQIESFEKENKDVKKLKYNLAQYEISFGQFKPEIYQILNGEDIRLTTYYPNTDILSDIVLDNLNNSYE